MRNASYNPEDDILRLLWSENKISESDEVEPGVILDYDEAGGVVEVEILDASKKINNLSPDTVAKTVV